MSNQSFEFAISAACRERTPEQAEIFRKAIAMVVREMEDRSRFIRECIDAEIEDADGNFVPMPGQPAL